MSRLAVRAASVSKALAALTAGAAIAVSADLLSGTAERWVTGVLAVATGVVVFYAPRNVEPTEYRPEHQAPDS